MPSDSNQRLCDLYLSYMAELVVHIDCIRMGFECWRKPELLILDMYLLCCNLDTYDHRTSTIALPVRSAVLKRCTGGLVVRWVTTGESPLLYVFEIYFCFFSLTWVSVLCHGANTSSTSVQDVGRVGTTFFKFRYRLCSVVERMNEITIYLWETKKWCATIICVVLHARSHTHCK